MIIFALKNELMYIVYSSILSTVISIILFFITTVTESKINYSNINSYRGLPSPGHINVLSLQTKLNMKIGSRKAHAISQVSDKDSQAYFKTYKGYDLIHNYLKGNLVMVSQNQNEIIFLDTTLKEENNLISVVVLSSMLKNSMIYLNIPCL